MGSSKINDSRKQPALLRFNIYRAELPNLGETHIIVAWASNTPRADWGNWVDQVEARTARDAAQVYLDRVSLSMPFTGMSTLETGVYCIVMKQRR